MEMRRPKRKVTDEQEIRRIIEECQVCRLGLNDEGNVYIVPMNFGYGCSDGKLTFYVHCAKVGRKVEVLKKNPEVCLELDCRHRLIEDDKPCRYSYCFASLIGNGTAEFVENAEDKEQALAVIMKHQTGKDFPEYDPKWVNAVAVVKVELKEYTCKQHDGTN